MRLKSIWAALILMVASLQTANAQGFRVYKSDGTVAQFSFRTDSIVFYDGIGSDVDFGPFTPVNQMIAGTWYDAMGEKTFTFNEDGTTDYLSDATYEFMPYQGTIIIYYADGAPTNILKVYKVKANKMVVSAPDGSNLSVWSSAPLVHLVASITLSNTSLSLHPNEVFMLTATVLPSDADNSAVTWESSDEAVASINNEGLVTALATGNCTITCSATDGSGVKTECAVTVTKAGDSEEPAYLTCPDGHHPHAIDLGLPSGTKWCCCNVGATKPEGYGGYYAWGETNEKSYYDWNTYKYWHDSDGDGNVDEGECTNIGSDIAGTCYDAATVNMGAPWRMPSTEQQRELINNCSWKWTQQNGINGELVTSPNGGQIFLPAAGNHWGGELDYAAGSNCLYWSSSFNPIYDYCAYDMYTTRYFLYWGNYGYRSRDYGLSVRAVRP